MTLRIPRPVTALRARIQSILPAGGRAAPEPARRPQSTAPEGSGRLFRLCLLLFLAGVLAGALAGCYLSPAGASALLPAGAAAGSSPDTLWEAVWEAGRFFLLLLVLSTSLLGVLLTPAAVVLRGYLLGCSVAALYAALAWEGLLRAALVSGIPALCSVPCFLALSEDAIQSARGLFLLRLGRRPEPLCPAMRAHLALAAVLTLALGCYSRWLLPLLLGKL